jgi:hypothetical protein
MMAMVVNAVMGKVERSGVERKSLLLGTLFVPYFGAKK